MSEPPPTIRVLGWLVLDTFRQAAASRVMGLLLALSVVGTLTCASASVRDGTLTLAFGRVTLSDLGTDPARGFLALLALSLGGGLGTLVALLGTAGFLPDALQPASAAVLLSKPTRRSVLVLGKVLGVFAFVTAHAIVFVAGTTLALGLKTGTYALGAWWCVPVLLLQFASGYAFSALLAVSTRNTAACAFGSVLFWLICFGVNYGRYAALGLPTLAPHQASHSPALLWFIEAGYWLMPKPADLMVLLDRAIGDGRFLADLPEFRQAIERGKFFPAASILSTTLFVIAFVGMTAQSLEDVDY